MKVFLGTLCLVMSLQAISQEKSYCQASTVQRTYFHNRISRGIDDGFFYWDIGKTIYIKFLNGSDKLRIEIQAVAKQWQAYANIKFEFREYGESHIRIDLNNSYLSSSIGTTAFAYPQDEPNVHMDTANFSDKKIMNRDVLHVFGHILGLQHENIVALSGRKWNINETGLTLQIMSGLIEPYSVSHSNGLIADRKSIMYQSLPFIWTNEKYHKRNEALSSSDIHLINMLYPFEKLKKADQFFSIKKYDGTRVDAAQFGFCFYPQFELQTRDWSSLQFSILLYDLDGKPVVNNNDRYVLDDQLSTTKAVNLLANKTVSVNQSSNDFGLFLPYSEIPVEYKGKQLMAVFRVYIPDNAKEDNASPDFNSKPFYISVPK